MGADVLVADAGADWLSAGIYDGAQDWMIGGAGVDHFQASGGFKMISGALVANVRAEADVIFDFEIGADRFDGGGAPVTSRQWVTDFPMRGGWMASGTVLYYGDAPLAFLFGVDAVNAIL
jgi:hypothetical protein